MWYYAQDGQRKGPVSEDALRDMARDGALQPTDLVWREGMSEWAPAAQATGFEFAGAAEPAADPGTLYAGPEAAASGPSYSRQPPSYAQHPSPYAAPQAQIAPAAAAATDYLPWSIAATFLCCNFTGVVAVIFAVKTKSAQTYGDQAEVQRCGRLAKLWFWWTFGIGLSFWVLYLTLYVFVMAAAMSSEM